MFKKKLLVSLLIAAGALGAIATPIVAEAQQSYRFRSHTPPPAPRNEAAPEARRGYVWSPGYWEWRANKYRWVKGSWERERRGHVYSPYRWIERGGRWELERGHWQRASRDRDRDGVPNKMDRRPDNPNRS